MGLVWNMLHTTKTAHWHVVPLWRGIGRDSIDSVHVSSNSFFISDRRCFQWAVLALQWKPNLLARALMNMQKELLPVHNRFKNSVVCDLRGGEKLGGTSLIYIPKVCLEDSSWFFSKAQSSLLTPTALLLLIKLKISSSNLGGLKMTNQESHLYG